MLVMMMKTTAIAETMTTTVDSGGDGGSDDGVCAMPTFGPFGKTFTHVVGVQAGWDCCSKSHIRKDRGRFRLQKLNTLAFIVYQLLFYSALNRTGDFFVLCLGFPHILGSPPEQVYLLGQHTAKRPSVTAWPGSLLESSHSNHIYRMCHFVAEYSLISRMNARHV